MPDVTAAVARLRDHDPARDLLPLSSTENAAIHHRIVSTTPTNQTARTSGRRLSRGRAHRMLVGLPSAAVALTAAAVAALALASQGTTPPPASAAAALYASAAAVARSGPSLELGPQSYLYERSVGWSRFLNPGGHALLHELAETWTARDGAGRGRDIILNPAVARRLPFRVSLAQDLRLRVSAHPFILAYPVALSYAQLQRLPSSPKRLAVVVGRLADRAARATGQSHSRPGHSVLVLYILHSIANSPAPTAVRAAVYEVMASTPGIRLDGHRRDALGRRGTCSPPRGGQCARK